MTMHVDVKKLTIDGVMIDSDVERHKDELVRMMYDQMRDDGHIPLLDMDPQFSVVYDFENDVRNFVLSVYGIEGDNPWEYSGVSNGRPIKKYSTNPK